MMEYRDHIFFRDAKYAITRQWVTTEQAAIRRGDEELIRVLKANRQMTRPLKL